MLDPAERTSRELFLTAVSGAASEVEPWVIDRVTALADEEDVEAGRTVFAEGEPSEFIYFMRDGRFRLTREGAPTWIYSGRWVIGPADVIMERPYLRTGVALTRVSLLKLRGEDWLDLLEDSFELARGAVSNSIRGVAALEVRAWTKAASPRGQAMAPIPRIEGPLTFVDRLATFAEMPILRGAGVQVLTDLVGLVEERTFEPGERLWVQGTAPGKTFLMLEGEVAATRADPALTVLFGPGSAVGGAASLGEPSAAWDARATRKTRTLSLHWEDWFDLMEEHFDLVRSALGGLWVVREALLDQLAAETGEIELG